MRNLEIHSLPDTASIFQTMTKWRFGNSPPHTANSNSNTGPNPKQSTGHKRRVDIDTHWLKPVVFAGLMKVNISTRMLLESHRIFYQTTDYLANWPVIWEISILEHEPSFLVSFDVVGPLVKPAFVLIQLTIPCVRHCRSQLLPTFSSITQRCNCTITGYAYAYRLEPYCTPPDMHAYA